MTTDEAWETLHDRAAMPADIRLAARTLIGQGDLAIERIAVLAWSTRAVRVSVQELLSEIVDTTLQRDRCEDGTCPYCGPPVYH